MRLLAFLRLACAVLIATSQCHAAGSTPTEPPRVKSPVPPCESLKNIVVPAGLKVELVACEPQIIDPVAMRFDEHGRLWVVEMRDYPTGPTKEYPARSRISLLTDKDGDGFYETATVFADNLKFATGVQPWQGGVFVTMAGEVAYMKDTNGDDKADLIETWYKGFSQGNQQLRANHPRLALDNHIYIANGLRGGNIIDARHPDAKPVSISGRDFRFDPLTREFEPVSGDGQFGLTFDDYGNRFICMNRNPAMHVVLEDWQLKKNPLVAVAAVTHDVAKIAGESRLFPIAKSWTTSHLHANQFTAACAVDVYRGDALPREYYGNIYTCDPTAHLVHREVMKPDGVTFTSTTPNLGAEFFASRDEWCSPVNLEGGPDGALYVVDMYRAVIEHPEWVPVELKHRPDQMLGNDLGRIYRIVPKDFQRPLARNLTKASTGGLVKAITSSNAWFRETAARLLLERQDTAALEPLRQLARSHDSELGRIQAVRLLEGLRAGDDDVLVQMLDDKIPRIVEQAIIAATSRVGNSNTLRNKIADQVRQADARVRFQALVTAMPLPAVPAFATDQWETDAMLIATGRRGGEALANMLSQPDTLRANVHDPEHFIRELARLAASTKDEKQQAAALKALLSSKEFGRVALTGFLAEIKRNGISIDEVSSKLDQKEQHKFDQIFDNAVAVASEENQSEAARGEAIDLAAYATDAVKTILPLALGEPSQPVRLRAIAALTKSTDTAPWQQVLDRFSSNTPAVQRAILDGVLMDSARIALLFNEVAAGKIKPTEFDANHVKLLLENRDPSIKSRAAQLFAAAIPADRAKVLADYQPVISMKGDTLRGRAVFEKRCATCHRIADVGIQFAPDISDSREKTPGQLLTDILQPNRAIDANYFSYTALTKSGQVHTGVLAAETSTAVTLKQAEGKSVTLRRDEIDELHSDGVSLMPDGLEKDIPLQDMTDLISFVKNWRYLADGKDIPGVH